MPRAATTLLFVVGACCHRAAAFLPPPSFAAAAAARNGVASLHVAPDQHQHRDLVGSDADGGAAPATTRRSFADDLWKGSIGSISLAYLSSSSSPAHASGGATAGGAYLLSAKQRYNERVIAGVKSFLNLDTGDLGAVKAFFASTDQGGWEDLSAAGYLLSNAFRTSSTKPPDSLPSVKKWKAFAKDVASLQKALAKKDGGKVKAAYESATEKLDAYLDAVELPSGSDLKLM